MQETFGVVAKNLMQSMLDSIEDQRRQDEEKATGQKRDAITEARISASTEAKRAQEKIAEALFGVDNLDPNKLKIQLTERLAARLGIDLGEERSNFSLGRAVEEAVKTLDSTQITKLEKDLGLDKAGISLATVIAAIKNPYGDDNVRLMEGLTKAANGGKADFDTARVLQRLADVANPKTLEELKLGPQGYDPTRVEDTATRAERREDIAALEASQKLDDVQKMQDAVEEGNRKTSEPAAAGKTPSDNIETDIIAVLAAVAEQVQDGASDTGETPPITDGTEATDTTSEVTTDDITEVNAQAIEDLASDSLAAGQAALLPISINDIGLYELLKKTASA